MSLSKILDLIFDNLFILIILASFILPMFRRSQKKGQAPNPQAKKQTKPSATTGRASRTAPQGQQQANSSGSSDFQKRLEEARRRVQDAMETPSTSAELPTSPTIKPMQTPVKAFQPKAPTQTPAPSAPSLLGNQSRNAHPLMGNDTRTAHPLMQADNNSSFLPSESATAQSSFGQEQAPLKLERRTKQSKKKNGATVSKRLLNFDEKAINSGFIWHYILSEPIVKQRRKKFQHPS